MFFFSISKITLICCCMLICRFGRVPYLKHEMNYISYLNGFRATWTIHKFAQTGKVRRTNKNNYLSVWVPVLYKKAFMAIRRSSLIFSCLFRKNPSASSINKISPLREVEAQSKTFGNQERTYLQITLINN